MSADRHFPSCTQTIGLTPANTALLNCFLFLLVSPCRERDRSEDQHLRDEFRARVRHGHGECVLFLTAGHILITTVSHRQGSSDIKTKGDFRRRSGW